MSVAVIADCHLGGPGGEPGPLLGQLKELPGKGCRRLVLLGDVFQAWVGKRSFETPLIHRVLGALRELAERGVRLDYVEGNRDFFIAGSRYAKIFTTVATELAFEVGGVRYLAVHGDGLNDRDRQYLFWRWLSKSPPVRWATVALPSALAQRVMHSVEAGLSDTNFKHKAEVPEAAILRYAGRRLAEGFDVLLLGHFHQPRTWSVDGGEVRVLDAWFNDHHVEWLVA